ncbi:MAG: hypothetical protein ACQESR_00030 [Planctomycetota bacterium]
MADASAPPPASDTNSRPTLQTQPTWIRVKTMPPGTLATNHRSWYISGGWIFPGGKRPDASRPPVGRTRGGERHPRPV